MDPVSAIANAVGAVFNTVTAGLGIAQSKQDRKTMQLATTEQIKLWYNDPSLAIVCADGYNKSGTVSPICMDAGIYPEDVARINKIRAQEKSNNVATIAVVAIGVVGAVVGYKLIVKA